MDPLLLAGGAALLFFLMGKKDEDDVDEIPPDDDDGGSGGGITFSDPNATPPPSGGGAKKAAYQGGISGGDPGTVQPEEPGMGFIVPDAGPSGGEVDLLDYDRSGDQWPRLGSFYQIKQGDKLADIAEKALKDGVYRAYGIVTGAGVPPDGAKYPIDSDYEAAADLVKMMDDTPLTKPLWQLMLMSPWNDMVYGTWGMGPGGVRGPCGRGIKLVPKYFANRKRMMDGFNPVRSMPVLDQSYLPGGSKENYNAQPIGGEAAGNKYPYIWIPGIDLASLVDITGASIGITDQSKWVLPAWPGEIYGQINPPPPIFDRSFAIPESYRPTIEKESVPEWGCDQWAIQNWI
ncbi:MAG: hypothetical protein GY930_18135 [bacterium]|nr:hypothetical protein [Hyphomicrobium sp.]MCP5023675.1 hypothetical protein [bacterium]